MLSFEAKYREEAMAVPARAGFGLLKIWIGRFYLGLWGVVALLFGTLGAVAWFWRVLFVDGNHTNNPLLNFIRGQVLPPPPSAGLTIPRTSDRRFLVDFYCLLRDATFFAWMMRQVDISRLLKIGYQVPIAYGAVFSSWCTIQIVRPLLLGQLVGRLSARRNGSPGLAVRVWVSLLQLLLQPISCHWHCCCCLAAHLCLSLHGATILSASRLKSEGVTEDNINRFYWDFFGYSIGEVGIHRLAFWTAILCVLISNLVFGVFGHGGSGLERVLGFLEQSAILEWLWLQLEEHGSGYRSLSTRVSSDAARLFATSIS